MNLYIAHLGYYDSTIGDIYELHTNVHVVAPDIKTARDKIISLPLYQSKNMHIDGIEELLMIDGYSIHATKSDSAQKANRSFKHEDLSILA